MVEYHFGVVQYRHIPTNDVESIDKIARKHDCTFVQIKDGGGKWLSWFSGPNRGDPFNGALAETVLSEVERFGFGHYFNRIGGSE